MSVTEIVVAGTLKADGTLELDQKPNLTPGRVQVVLRQEAAAVPQEGWWPYLQRIRADREAAGYLFMTEPEMEAHLQWLREDEERINMRSGLS
jgi:hypothetical protein